MQPRSNSRGIRSVFIVVTVVLANLCATNNSVLAQGTKSRQLPTLVCAVSSYDPPQMSMDAVVLIENGIMKAPFAEQNENASKAFAAEYFKTGLKYQLTFGGGHVGTAVVKESNVGCSNIHATVEAQGGARIRGTIMGLATNSELLEKTASSRRAPTDEERSAVMQLVRQIYRSKKTSESLLQRLSTTNLVATDLNNDGKVELIGSFLIKSPNQFRRDLLLIAEPAPNAELNATPFSAGLIEYQAYKLPPEGFDSAIDFVDQLDIDGDGTGELFARQQGFDAYGYVIYKKQNGRWRRVHSFIGDAC